MDYDGNDDSSSEIFWLSMPNAGTRLSSTMTGTLEQLNLTVPCTSFVQWLEGEEVEVCNSVLCGVTLLEFKKKSYFGCVHCECCQLCTIIALS